LRNSAQCPGQATRSGRGWWRAARWKRRTGVGVIAGVFLLSLLTAGASAALRLQADDISTRSRYRYPETTADVDTVAHEIRLPRMAQAMPGLIDARPDGWDLVTVSGQDVRRYAFNGRGMVLSGVKSVSGATVPLGVAARWEWDDLVVLGATAAQHWSWNGAAMVLNPLLSIPGLNNPRQAAVRPGSWDTFVLTAGQVIGYSFDGTGMVPDAGLTIGSGLRDPSALALHPLTRDVAVLDGNAVRYYQWNGSALRYNPALAVSGLDSPAAIQIGVDGTLYVVEAGGVNAYQLDGMRFRLNRMRSIVASGAIGVALPGAGGAVAVRFPDQIRVYQWNGNQMVENSALRIMGLLPPTGGGAGYAPSAVVQSAPLPAPEQPVEALVLQASQDLPDGTSVAYDLTNDGGATWHAARLGRGVLFPDAGTGQVAWRATLRSSNPSVTPRLLPEISLDQIWRPDAPSDLAVTPLGADGLVSSATPALQWRFTDRDQPDWQGGFQVIISDRDTGEVIHDSGKISTLPDAAPPPESSSVPTVPAPDPRGSASRYAVPAGVLGGRAGYSWKVRVWDRYDLPSPWSQAGPGSAFEMLALTGVMVTSVVHPPASAPALPTGLLPVPVKAGAAFGFTVDSLGPVQTVDVTFSDGGYRSASPELGRGAPQNRWAAEYFTDSRLPDGTVITASFVGTRADGRQTTRTVPIVIIAGSIDDDYTVILTR